MQVALDKWTQMTFNFTHKMHLLLSHSVDIIRSRKGLNYIWEIMLERACQIRFKDNLVISRISDRSKGQKNEAKKRRHAKNQEFKEVVKHVNEISSRKRNDKVIKQNLD